MNVSNEAIQEIINQEIELQSRVVRENSKRLEELLHIDFLEIGSTGKKYSKADIIEILPNSDFSEMSADNFEGRLLTNDLLLLNYDLELNIKGEVVKSKRTSIWKKEKTSWEMYFHQSTIKPL